MTRRNVLRLVGVVFATALLGVAVAGSGAWRTVFLATFEGVPDGPGDGLSYPADLGLLPTFTATGQPFLEVAPASGVFGERLYLDDAGGLPLVSFGVEARFARVARRGVAASFEVRLEKPGTTFSAEIADTSGVDIARVAFSEDGSISVNGKPQTHSGHAHVNYGVEILLDATRDQGVLILTDLDADERLGSWTFEIRGGYRPVSGLVFTNLGASAGSASIDNILVVEPK